MKRIDNPFTSTLIDWYSRVKRDLPWRQTKNPYNVWLSEIILQQTRVDQGLPYYEQFITNFPTVFDLARASERSVMKTWEGLGYYSRARNLHATARYVATNLDGKFPDNYEGLLKLKGVGPYTAAAIASICFDEPVPVVDGNVFRFISRHFGIKKNIAEQKNRKYFEKVLNALISPDQPGMFNQSLMEYGSTICRPTGPDCEACLFRSSCYAYEHKKQTTLPVKVNKTRISERHIAYLIFDTGMETLMRERKSSIWTGLYEFHNLDHEQPVPDQGIRDLLKTYQEAEVVAVSSPVRHLLSHRKLWVTFYRIKVSAGLLDKIGVEFNLDKFSWEEVLTLPRPKVIVNYLREAEF